MNRFVKLFENYVPLHIHKFFFRNSALLAELCGFASLHSSGSPRKLNRNFGGVQEEIKIINRAKIDLTQAK